jgi:hypothetical protein
MALDTSRCAVILGRRIGNICCLLRFYCVHRRLVLAPRAAEDLAGALKQLLFPFRDLVRVQP